MKRILIATALLLTIAAITEAQEKTEARSPLTPEQQQQWRQTLADYDYVGIAIAYADFMIEHGRDTYGKKHTPLFVTGIDRETGKMIKPPFAHVKRKPFMPGWERDRELRGSDRNYGQADPLDQLTLLQLMHRLTETTGDNRYAEEADKTAAWWIANAQSPIGLYPWGTHTSWNVTNESGGGTFEFNHPWPFWELTPQALQKYAMGLWDHYIADKKTGNFNRHAHSHKHGPGGGMEFPWPGSAMIATWVEAYLAKPDLEYVRAIDTILNRWESLRDDNGHLAPCSSYGEWAWYLGYMQAANRLDDWADRIESKQPELAEKMRDYGRKNDAAYLKLAEVLLDIKRVGPIKSYLRNTGSYKPDRLDIVGGPWQDRKDYAGFAVMLHERMKRNDSPALQKRYRQAVLDTAEIYMSINPEVQWAVWGENMAGAIRLMLSAHELTGNAAYLHRADHFGRLAVDLFLDDVSPLPKITSHDNFYEIESVTTPSTDVWMLAVLELRERLAKVDDAERQTVRIVTTGGVWDCTKLSKSTASVALSYGEDGERTLFLSRREKSFAPAKGLPIDGLELIASDHVNKLPTLEEAKLFNGAYRRRFSGKHREPSTATYGGFKDVLDHAGLLLVNHGKKTAKVIVTVTYHDSWDDRETEEHKHTLGPGERVEVMCDAPAKRFIRRLDFSGNVAHAVKLEQFAFAMTPRSKLTSSTKQSKEPNRTALVFLIAGQSNAGGVAAFSPETNEKSGLAKKHPTIPGSTAKEVGIPTAKDAYPRSYIWGRGFERLTPGKNLKGGYNDPNRHGIELPMAMLLEKQYPDQDKYFVKHGPGGHNLHTQWAAGRGPDYKTFMTQFNGVMADLKKRYAKVRVVGLYWDQGESDRKQALAYEKNLRALFIALRKETGMPGLPIFVRKHLFQHDKPDFAPIIDAQVKITEEDTDAHLLDLDLGSNEKNFKAWAWTDNNGHLSSKAYLELARRILTKAAVPKETGAHSTAGEEWGPFVGPWARHEKNPIIRLEGKESYSIQNGPQSVVRWNDKWHMFLMTSQPMVTKLAVSDDGLSWTRPHHDYLLKPEMPWEGSYNLAKAAVLRDDEIWLYYFGKKDRTEMVALARSKDLVNWKKEPKQIFTHKDSRLEGSRAFPDCVIKEGDTWYMYYDVGFDYHHTNSPDGYAIGVATSKDGISWTDSPKSPTLTVSGRTPDSWDDGMVSQCSVHKIGGWFFMLYSGGTNNYGRKYSGKNRMAFGLARARHPEGPWEKYPHNPVFEPTGNEKDFDGVYLQHPCPVKVGDQWRLYYNGWTLNPNANSRLGAQYAIGLVFTKLPLGSHHDQGN